MDVYRLDVLPTGVFDHKLLDWLWLWLGLVGRTILRPHGIELFNNHMAAYEFDLPPKISEH